MCELLGLSSNVQADLRFSLAALFQRGGHTDNHSDGWGLGLYKGKSAQIFSDPLSSIDSDLAQHILLTGYKSNTVISHIRKANRGRVCQENTHPFKRELWGKEWLFAHNGQLKGIKKKSLSHFRPIGTTDSEYSFCYLLDQLKQYFPEGTKNEKLLSQAVESICHEINQHGVFNILLSDSSSLFAFCSKKLCWLTREYPFGKANFIDTKETIDLSKYNSREDRMVLISSCPITDNENWNCMTRGEFRAFKHGKCTYQSQQLTQKAA